MVKMKKVLTQLRARGEKSESGYTLMEILVAIALLAVLTVAITTTIINTTQTSDKFTRGTMNESQLLNAVSLVTRDISLANKITYAGEAGLSVETLENNAISQVSYFYWNLDANSIPAKPATIAGEATPDDPFAQVRANKASLPTQPGIVEYRIINGNTASPIIRNLVEGYSPGGNVAYQLFTYYDTKNKEILLDASSSLHVANNKLDTIRRVEIHFTSYIDDRANAMEIKTSATPRFLGQSTTSQNGSVTLDKMQKPILYGHLAPRTREANVWWTPIAGADSYILYRGNRLGSPQESVIAVLGGADSKYDDTTVKPGETYTYRIVAQGFVGDSDSSDAVRLRVTPDSSSFTNIDTKRGDDGSPISGYTVARNLTNQLSWKASAGENIKYRLYTGSGASATLLYDGAGLTYAHGSRNYGDVTRYYVIAYNDTIQSFDPNNPSFVTGGTAPDSPYIDLISPPIRATITGTALNDTTSPSRPIAKNLITVTNTAANPQSKGYEFEIGNTATTVTSSAQTGTRTTFEDTPGWGSTRHYSATAYNDAGDGPTSNVVKVDQIPGPFAISSLSNPTGYAWVIRQEAIKGSLAKTETRGVMSASWGASTGATEYDVDRRVSDYLSNPAIPKSLFDYETDKPNLKATTTSFSGVQPGSIYNVTVSAVAANGKTRATTEKLLTRPDVPQSGMAEQMCLANGAGVTVAEGQSPWPVQNYGAYVQSNTYPKYGAATGTDISYNLKNGSAPSTKKNQSLSTGYFTWLQNDGYGNSATISFQNVIDAKIGTDRGVKFGLSDGERRSYALDLTLESVAQFTGACNTTTGGKIIGAAGTTNGYNWVIPVNVCYGYRLGHDYSQYYMDPNDPWRAGYVYGGSGYQPWFVKNNGACKWRYDPVTGTDPYWQSQ